MIYTMAFLKFNVVTAEYEIEQVCFGIFKGERKWEDMLCILVVLDLLLASL